MNVLGLCLMSDNPGYCNFTFVREFYANLLIESKYKTVPVRGKDVRFTIRILNEVQRNPHCDAEMFSELKDKPPCRDNRHTFCGVESNIRCERSKYTGRHNILYSTNFNQVARV